MNNKESDFNPEKHLKLKKTIFIFGISSFVGSSLAEYLKKDFRVIGSYCDTPVDIEGVLCINLDIKNRDAIQLALYTFKPDVTIYCIGLTSLHKCADNEKLADALNTTGVFSVASFTERYRSQLIYLSSAYVFSGEKVTFLEDDTPLANTTYGKSKGSAEFFIQKTCLNYLIFRCCSLYGRSVNPQKPTWFEIIQRELFRGEPVIPDNNVKVGWLDVIYLAMIIKLSINKEVNNRLFQVSSQDIMSYYEFANAYAETFEDAKDLIRKGSWSFPQVSSSIIQSDISDGLEYQMDIENLEGNFNVKMPSIQESLELTRLRLGGKSTKRSKIKKSSEITFI